jgi:hypothetical protein
MWTCYKCGRMFLSSTGPVWRSVCGLPDCTAPDADDVARLVAAAKGAVERLDGQGDRGIIVSELRGALAPFRASDRPPEGGQP